jgi:hypothetical protein
VSRTVRVPVLVPTKAALVFDAEHGWHLLEAPPAWWIEQQLAE